MKYLLCFLLFVTTEQLLAQEDFTWWNEKHNWDGYTSWVQYMTMSTSYMGPNALPVPEVEKGRIDSSAELEIAGDYHYSKGDKTTDFYLRGFLPLYNNRVAVSIDVIPYEWFKTDTITRDLRAARTRSGKGGAGGDIYFYACFQLLHDHGKWPDLLLQTALRTASGTNLRNVRYTDGPGYFFDLSGGKNFEFGKAKLRFYLMGGLYIYQTFDLQHLQNDCKLYGSGADLHFGKIILSQSVAGYSGYLDIGDKPLVYRAGVRLKNKVIDWKFSYQWGLNDYAYQRYRLSLIFHLPV